MRRPQRSPTSSGVICTVARVPNVLRFSREGVHHRRVLR